MMGQSPEYPDLPFVQPRAWGAGRDGKAVRYIVIHYTAGAERNTSAEDGAAYDQRRTDSVSTHYFVDPDSIVQCVLTRDRANAALHRGNRLGIQYELCGTQQTRAQWLDTASDAILWRAARQVARDCVKYGIPARRLSVAETRAAWYSFPNGPRGIVGHVDCTNAYPEDGGTHTDPGTEFPWDVLLSRVQQFIDGGDDMALDPLQAAELANTEHYLQSIFGLNDKAVSISDTVTARDVPSPFVAAFKRLTADVAELKARPAAVLTDDDRADIAAKVAEILRPAIGDLVTAAAREAVDGAVIHAAI